MDQLFNFFKGLFDTNLWPARWVCGQWTTFHGWLYIISDLIIWLSYFLIPVIIIDYFTKRRTTLKFQKGYFLFAAFILLCGLTHFFDALMFWIPVYRLNALIRFITAIISMSTVLYLIKILPQAFRQKTSLELENEIAKRIEVEKKLAEAITGLKAFAYIASHDLQEPLRKIRLYSSMLNEKNKEKFDESSKEYADKILSSSIRMQSLVEDVLSLSSIDNQAELKEASVETTIGNAKESLEIRIAERGAVVHYSSIPKVKGNEAYLSQLFTNLISNSIKFSKGQPVITIDGEKHGDFVTITVADNGIGMNQEDTTRIFEAFQRLNSKKEYEGSGIGLSICKKIIDLHNGKISVNSELGKGTTFTIILPAA